MKNKNQKIPLPVQVENMIYLIRGHRVMLDNDLAVLYGVETRRLNEQVKRNSQRFPKDFMFQLTREEYENLKSQNATSSWGGRRTFPFVFTEHGAIMLASVLNSAQAISASVQVVRAFIRMREVLLTHKELARKLEELERKYDTQFIEVFSAIRQLMTPVVDVNEREILKKGRRE